MALPSSGAISMSQVRTELGLTGSISLGQSEVRALAGKPSGAISLSDLRGKSAVALTATLTCGYRAEVVGEKGVGHSELRGFWAYNDDILGGGADSGGSISPASVSGHTISMVVEKNVDSFETYSDFVFCIAGHSVPLNFFNYIRVMSGSTLVREFTRNNSHANGDGVGFRTELYTLNGSTLSSHNVTQWRWPLSLNNRGQIFPTSGTRTIIIG